MTGSGKGCTAGGGDGAGDHECVDQRDAVANAADERLHAAVVLALFLFGGAVLRDFAFAILIGVVVGTYSSILSRRRSCCGGARGGGSGAAVGGENGARWRRFRGGLTICCSRRA